MIQLHVSSDAVKEGEMIPSKYTCDGKNISPPPHIGNIPEAVMCMALIINDPEVYTFLLMNYQRHS
ncbi:MAG: hypothetical protein IPP72_15770 [Chitinophagaceae bacterium]|nr:hypothetical protein [Chitinophagaceae bacterium]